MKLLTYQYEGQKAVGRLNADETRVIPLRVCGVAAASMRELIERYGGDLPVSLRQMSDSADAIPLGDVRVLPPLDNQMEQVICIGCNYQAYAEAHACLRNLPPEAANRETPIVYFKRAEEPVGHGGAIPSHAELSNSLDYAVTLAVVLGKQAHHICAENAAGVVFGYTVMSDITMRDLIVRYKQPYYGKALDGFLPIGPWIATADEFAFPPALELKTRVNGELRQKDNTAHMTFGIAQIIETLTRGMTLRAGTVIATGTPFGTGFCFDPPRYLKAGDLLESEIEGVGAMQNRIV